MTVGVGVEGGVWDRVNATGICKFGGERTAGVGGGNCVCMYMNEMLWYSEMRACKYVKRETLCRGGMPVCEIGNLLS